MENSRNLLARLPAPLQQSLLEDPPSPLKQWLGGHYYNAYAYLRHASTFSPDITSQLIYAAAAGCLIDAAQEQRPVLLSYAEPIWRSLTEGQVPAQFLAESTPFPGDNGPSRIHTMGEINTHVALGLSRTSALDHDTREHLIQKSLADASPIATALGWFAFDIETTVMSEMTALSRKYIGQWIRIYPDDPDVGVMTIRSYLQSATRVGAIGALDTISSSVPIATNSHEAAWAIAWHQATQNQEHEVCAELAIRRATFHDKINAKNARERWIFLYGFHEERRKERTIHTYPVRRELLELMYKMDDPHVPAALALSIAARTNHLERVLRETLPFINGPTTPILRAVFSAEDTKSASIAAAQCGIAGLLVAMRIEQAAFHFREQHDEIVVPPAQPPPASIFQDNDIDEEVLLANPHTPAESAHATDSNTRSHTEVHHTNAPNDDAAHRQDVLTSPSSSPNSAIHPHLFSTLEQADSPSTSSVSTEKTSEKISEKLPEISDILLAAFLPDAPRQRADRILARRIHKGILRDRSLVRAFEERLALLPTSSWAIAMLFAQYEDPHTAKSWMSRIAKSTEDNTLRAERYRLLAKHTAQQCQDLNQATEYLLESLDAFPCNEDALQLIDTLFARTRREHDLVAIYQRAIAQQQECHAHANDVSRWINRLHDIQSTHAHRSSTSVQSSD